MVTKRRIALITSAALAASAIAVPAADARGNTFVFGGGNQTSSTTVTTNQTTVQNAGGGVVFGPTFQVGGNSSFVFVNNQQCMKGGCE